MKTFKDLVPKTHPNDPTGAQAKMFFDNGYGVSVVRHAFSYGHESNLFEMAVLRGNEDGWNLTYTTPVTRDVLGNLTEDDVTLHMKEVQELPRLGKSATVKAAAEATGAKYLDLPLRDLLSDYDISED